MAAEDPASPEAIRVGETMAASRVRLLVIHDTIHEIELGHSIGRPGRETLSDLIELIRQLAAETAAIAEHMERNR